VCAGQCMPIKEQNLPWWAEFTKYWAKPKYTEWRCVEAVTKLKKVQLMCENGETRTYKIKIVKSCRCKSYEREPNRTGRNSSSGSVKKDKGGKDKGKKNNNKSPADKDNKDSRKQQRRRLLRRCRNLPKKERRKCRRAVKQELESNTSDTHNKHSKDTKSHSDVHIEKTGNLTLQFNESPIV